MNEEYQELFATAAEAVSRHMLGCVMMSAQYLERKRKERSEAFLAFEMGVLEYFHRAAILPACSMDQSQSFFELAIKYGNEAYEKDALQALDFWTKIAVQNLMHDKRELGFESVNRFVDENGKRRPGHAPTIFFCDALGLDFADLMNTFAEES